MLQIDAIIHVWVTEQTVRRQSVWGQQRPELTNRLSQRWSREFGPVVKVDRMTKEVIQNEETKEPFTRF